MTGPVGVVLLNMGGPDAPEAVRPFLENLFSDPEILPAPSLLRRPLARWIAARRSRFVTDRYRAIGGGSPIARITREQAAALQQALGPGFAVTVAMRYWPPRADAAVADLGRRGVGRVVAVPLYPQFSRTTTGSSLADLERAVAAGGLADRPRVAIRSWHEFPPYLDALAETVAETLERAPGATVLFSAHGLPVRVIEAGDPYLDQVNATVAGVLRRLPPVPHRLAFQSRAGPVKWLEPATEDAIRALGRDGVDRVVVVPVSFVSDHIETLHEIDIEYAAVARDAGIAEFLRAPSLNTRPAFIRALAALVRQRGTAPAAPGGNGR